MAPLSFFSVLVLQSSLSKHQTFLPEKLLALKACGLDAGVVGWLLRYMVEPLPLQSVTFMVDFEVAS